MSKIPRVQKTWREFKERQIESLSILNGWSVVQDIQEVLYTLVIPHLIATHWYSSFARPRKYTVKKKNRNI